MYIEDLIKNLKPSGAGIFAVEELDSEMLQKIKKETKTPIIGIFRDKCNNLIIEFCSNGNFSEKDFYEEFRQFFSRTKIGKHYKVDKLIDYETFLTALFDEETNYKDKFAVLIAVDVFLNPSIDSSGNQLSLEICDGKK